MAGVGKLLKQAQKMQRSIEALQTQLEAKVIDVTSGGGAVKLSINGAGKFTSLTLDPEFLKEDAKLVSDTLLVAMQDAAKQARDASRREQVGCGARGDKTWTIRVPDGQVVHHASGRKLRLRDYLDGNY